MEKEKKKKYQYSIPNSYPSWYDAYQPLTFQQQANLKHKYDNRLYYTLKYKTITNSINEELFRKRRNTLSFLIARVNNT